MVLSASVSAHVRDKSQTETYQSSPELKMDMRIHKMIWAVMLRDRCSSMMETV